MGKSGKALLAAAAVTGCLAAPGSASAASTFGADLADPALTPDSSDLGVAALTVTKSDTTAETGSPISGVMVSARVRTTGAASGFVRVLQPFLVANQFVNQGQEPVATTMAGDHVTEVPTRLRIAAGDRIAAAFPFAGFVSFLHSDPDAVYRCRNEPPAHAVGVAEFYNVAGCGPGSFEVLVQGTVEPDADDDGFGDETQDQCVGVAGPVNGCPAPIVPAPSPVATPVVGPTSAAAKKCRKGRKLKRGKCVKKKKK